MSRAFVQVRGLDGLFLTLRRLDAAARAELLAVGANAGGEVLRDAVAAEAPRKSDFLAEHIGTTPPSIAGGKAEVRIGPAGDAFYGGILNQGAKPHKIRPFAPKKRRGRRGNVNAATEALLRGGRRRRVLSNGSQIFQSKGEPLGTVRHPGVAANPFITRAFDRAGRAAIDAAGRAMWARVEQIAASTPKEAR